MKIPQNKYFDVLILGSGAAGLSMALRFPSEIKCAIVSKRDLSEGNTLYAQGGISAVFDPSDSLENHVSDTIKAGAGLCEEKVVREVVKNGPNSIRWLQSHGMQFTQDKKETDINLHLTREGGHSYRRVVHAADATGKVLENTLVKQVSSKKNVKIFEDHIAVDLIVNEKSTEDKHCQGAYLLDLKSDSIFTIGAKCVVIATGGASKAYLFTSNPDVATGDGIAMAWRAGCRAGNMEFIQFHPTCLYHPKAKSFLISEAVRGEGAHLLLPDGNRFMDQYDDRAELAPRDIVARAIDYEMKRLGSDNLYLDISHKSEIFIEKHFPNIHKKCLQLGFDMRKEPLPIVPAAHYTCGGVLVDNHGESDIPGLYVVGEAAYTGLHGANRMASNSLLECLVYSDLAAKHIIQNLSNRFLPKNLPSWDDSRVTDSDEEVVVSHNWDELRRLMWDYVGIVRSNKRLARAKNRINLLRNEIQEYYGNFHISNDSIELRNLVEVADLIVQSAQQRQESRGLHYNIDFPDVNKDKAQPTILIPKNYVSKV
tara:strand:+ start:6233 stop:7849 length:1617 start_codon:yes stop_codon:yes gene_type:complete